MVGAGLAIAAFVLTILCLFGAWLNVHGSGTVTGQQMGIDMDYGLREVNARSTVSGFSVRVSMDYSEVPGTSESSFVEVLNWTQALVLLALLFTLLMVLFTFLVGLGKVKDTTCVGVGPAMAEEPTTPGMVSTPTMSSLWGSDSMVMNVPGYGTVSLDMVWGPGWAWYLMIAAFICALVGTILMIGTGKKEKEATLAPPPISTPLPQYGYPIRDDPERGPIIERPFEEPSERRKWKK
jgi:hypothetical protein